jgi:hypothetical protein
LQRIPKKKVLPALPSFELSVPAGQMQASAEPARAQIVKPVQINFEME